MKCCYLNYYFLFNNPKAKQPNFQKNILIGGYVEKWHKKSLNKIYKIKFIFKLTFKLN